MSVSFRLQNMLETVVSALFNHGVPEQQHARLAAREIARAEHGIGAAIEQGTNQDRVFEGVVFQVGILDDREIAGGLLDRGAHGGALAAIDFVSKEANLRMCRRQAFEHGPGAVGRAVVDDDQLALHVFGKRGGQNLRDASLHHGPLVVYGHQDGKLHARVQQIILPYQGWDGILNTHELPSCGRSAGRTSSV